MEYLGDDIHRNFIRSETRLNTNVLAHSGKRSDYCKIHIALHSDYPHLYGLYSQAIVRGYSLGNKVWCMSWLIMLRFVKPNQYYVCVAMPVIRQAGRSPGEEYADRERQLGSTAHQLLLTLAHKLFMSIKLPWFNDSSQSTGIELSSQSAFFAFFARSARFTFAIGQTHLYHCLTRCIFVSKLWSRS